MSSEPNWLRVELDLVNDMTRFAVKSSYTALWHDYTIQGLTRLIEKSVAILVLQNIHDTDHVVHAVARKLEA